MQTLKYGPPGAQYPYVNTDTFIFFLRLLCQIIWMNVHYFSNAPCNFLIIELSYYMCVFLMARLFCRYPQILTLWPWLWVLTYFWKTLKLGIYFWTERNRAFILSIDIPRGKTFLSVSKFVISWPWSPTSTYFWKKLNNGINFLSERDLVYILSISIACRKTFLSVTNFDP